MSEPTPSNPVLHPGRLGRWLTRLSRPALLALILEIGLGLRVLAADAVEWYVRLGGSESLCLFPDTKIYWLLARTICAGAPYEYVEWGDIPHFAMRTPGYPLVLAACQAAFGERPLAVRLVQALLGVASVYLVYLLTREVVEIGRTGGVAGVVSGSAPEAPRAKPSRAWSIPLIAATMAAINPYYVALSAFILSEAVFVPLMLASLLGLAVLWPGRVSGADARGPRSLGGKRAALVAFGTGAAAGSAVMVRPSWALFVPSALAVWAVATVRDRLRLGSGLRPALIAASSGMMLCAVGFVLVMGPWWHRNERIYGRFIPTALWTGASLYDGLNPRATGASDMSFLYDDPEIWPLDELDQDAELTRRAVGFARERPGRAIDLAIIKLGRYWSPWPNADVLRSRAVSIASAAVELPLFILVALGAWVRRRDLRSWVLLAGPVLYFCALHTVFASSMRYRIPAELPALGLAAVGLSFVISRWSGKIFPPMANN